ncbi:MAG: hypothetical protein ABIT16_09085 [Croceibacterium sp.]
MTSALVSGLPPAQRLALAYCPARARPATLALLALDDRLASILRAQREPIASQMRLAWWRDVLARPQPEWPLGEPLLEALRSWHDASALGPLVDGWEALLSDHLAPPVITEFIAGRAQAFVALARELGVAQADSAEPAARTWALADLAAHVSNADERAQVIDFGRSFPPPTRLEAPLRPLAVLAKLGSISLAHGGAPLLGGPRSLFAALRTGITGR